MRKPADLLREEPVALTGFAGAVLNVVVLSGLWHPAVELVAALNTLVAAAYFLVRWLVVPTEVHQAAVTAAQSLGEGEGYVRAIQDVKALDGP